MGDTLPEAKHRARRSDWYYRLDRICDIGPGLDSTVEGNRPVVD